jgi:orotidine-5'-phosphate decarboxylase
LLQPHERIIVSLDVTDVSVAVELADNLVAHVGGFTISPEFYTGTYALLVGLDDPQEAAALLQNLRELFALTEKKLFWDGRWSGRPISIATAAETLQLIRPKFCTVHAAAVRNAIAAAVAKKGESMVLGVTGLANLDEGECEMIYGLDPDVAVVKFAHLLADAGADGIVCSPRELGHLRRASADGSAPSASLLKVAAGIRPSWSAQGNKTTPNTPATAIINGADYLVIGQPVTSPPATIGTPVEAAKRIAQEIANVMANA